MDEKGLGQDGCGSLGGTDECHWWEPLQALVPTARVTEVLVERLPAGRGSPNLQQGVGSRPILSRGDRFLETDLMFRGKFFLESFLPLTRLTFLTSLTFPHPPPHPTPTRSMMEWQGTAVKDEKEDSLDSFISVCFRLVIEVNECSYKTAALKVTNKSFFLLVRG